MKAVLKRQPFFILRAELMILKRWAKSLKEKKRKGD